MFPTSSLSVASKKRKRKLNYGVDQDARRGAPPPKVQERYKPGPKFQNFLGGNSISNMPDNRGEQKRQQAYEDTRRRDEVLRQLFVGNPTDVTRAEFNKACKAFPRLAIKPYLYEDGWRWQLDKGLEATYLEHHQLLAAGFMRWLEKGQPDQPKGGILGDVMGLGSKLAQNHDFLSLTKRVAETVTALACVAGDLLDLARDSSDQVSPPSKLITVVIVPSLALKKQWMGEIGNRCHSAISPNVIEWSTFLTYTFTLMEYNMAPVRFIVVTYHELKHSFENFMTKKTTYKTANSLHRLEWRRIIVDESQHIKDSKSQLFQACRALDADYHWALSGTPFPNGVQDCYAYLDYLRVPWAKDMSKGAFTRHFGGNQRELNKALSGFTMTRDRKYTIFGKPILKLPPYSRSKRTVEMEGMEKVIYDNITEWIASTFGQGSNTPIMETKCRHLLMILLRLRQYTSHPLVGMHFFPAFETSSGQLKQLVRETSASSLTSMQMDRAARTMKMFASAAREQIKVEIMDRTGKHLASDEEALKLLFVGIGGGPKSTDDLDPKKAFGVDRIKIQQFIKDGGQLMYGAKTRAVVEQVLEWTARYPSDKIIIFSQFLETIEITKLLLAAKGIKSVTYTGKQTQNARAKHKDVWAEDSTVKVLIMSLKTGSEGLNLIEGSRVIIVDLWWNSAAEQQASGRVYRYGQKKATEMVRVIVKGTVDERLLAIQKIKHDGIKAVLNVKTLSRLIGLDKVTDSDDERIDEDSEPGEDEEPETGDMLESPSESSDNTYDDADDESSESDYENDEGPVPSPLTNTEDYLPAKAFSFEDSNSLLAGEEHATDHSMDHSNLQNVESKLEAFLTNPEDENNGTLFDGQDGANDHATEHSTRQSLQGEFEASFAMFGNKDHGVLLDDQVHATDPMGHPDLQNVEDKPEEAPVVEIQGGNTEAGLEAQFKHEISDGVDGSLVEELDGRDGNDEEAIATLVTQSADSGDGSWVVEAALGFTNR